MGEVEVGVEGSEEEGEAEVEELGEVDEAEILIVGGVGVEEEPCGEIGEKAAELEGTAEEEVEEA